MKKSGEILLSLIPYLTLCAGLYQLTYWAGFEINGLSFISATEVLKSAIYPIVITFVFVIIGIVAGESIFNFDKELLGRGEGRKTKVGKALNSRIGISIVLILWIGSLYYLYNNGNTLRWIIWAFLFSSVPTTALDRIGLWVDSFDNSTVRLWVIRLLIYIPVFSFSSAKINSEYIRKNIKYDYVLVTDLKKYIKDLPKTDNDTLKFIGLTDKYLCFVTMDNRDKFFFKNDKVDHFKLTNFSKGSNEQK
jgi:hypothetical protein